MRDLFTREGFDYDFVFDWTLLNYSSSRNSRQRAPLLEEAKDMDVSRLALNADSDSGEEDEGVAEKKAKHQSKCRVF